MSAKLKREQHGQSHTDIYKIWTNMKSRCLNRECPYYKNYGGRGISICDEWRDSFVAFSRAIGPRPSPLHQIDRIDNNGHYAPGNVRWATKKEQALNQRKNRILTLGGESAPLSVWAEKVGLAPSTLQYRLGDGGMTVEQALKVSRRGGRHPSRFRPDVGCDKKIEIIRLRRRG